ncbi:hypothetical protein [Kozakia baliensis]|uniref:hypothetical protein n=1 Tax=Kozakia baliensis TaxID=153496 RepID=UPI001F268E08|nr:hypothetical protein [Kozakia baliensis]
MKGKAVRLEDIQARVAAGYAKAVAMLGVQGAQYRPVDALAPMENTYATPLLAFDVEARFGFAKPLGWGVPTEYVLMDTSDVSVGDILVCGDNRYFIARAEAMRPPLCVVCNHVVSVWGVTGTSTQIVADCPAAILLKARGESANSGMPGSTKPGQFTMYLPSLPRVALLPYMSVMTDLGVSYTINSVEASRFGFRCAISMQQV